jgi:hypothetical protein
MSLFKWFFGDQAPQKPAMPDSSGLSRMEATRPAVKRTGKEVPFSNAQPANRKGERIARRELLYSVVREAMMRAEVLSSSYKFKVLSLDGRGRQVMVMVDLSRSYGSETGRLAEIEALIAQAAKTRYDIVVTAVYWRMNEHVAVGDPNSQSRQAERNSQPAALESGPAPLQTASSHSAGRPGSPYDPIHPDEVAAFKSALAAGAARPAAVAAVAVGLKPRGAAASDGPKRPHSYTLLTGFEDTEMFEADHRGPNLSGTQYGDLN